MSEAKKITVTLEMVDSVSPVFRAIEALAATGLAGKFAMPANPINVIVMPGTAKAILVPSQHLTSLLWMAAENVRQTTYPAFAETQAVAPSESAFTVTN